MNARPDYDTVVPSETNYCLTEETSRILAPLLGKSELWAQLDDGTPLVLPHEAAPGPPKPIGHSPR